MINMITFPVKLPQRHRFRGRLRAAAALLHLLALGAATARAHAIPTSCCGMFEGLDMVPCLQDAAGGNISGACCSSLNQALDAGRRCLCSLLLSSSGGGVRVLAGLAAALPALPLALPLPGCLLYAPPLASCQVPVQEQTDAAPAAAAEAATASVTTVDSPPPQAAVMSPSTKSKKRSADGKAAADNGDGGAEEHTSRSDAHRRDRRTNAGEGIRTNFPTVVVAMAAFWFNYMIN
ncbi:non-specific lipid transfer protein GPI-anchored 31-like [Oryza brachyantha]|uniref:non-specific lipid transfer protein GPI-anchored 31-like n=1 Tax=Oryza brachyantha TaxID=4533 RepID=UPI001ADBD2CD|nr:non-specific lipid transfer protein GPI-anchored 31-like [Oryza brachyantha]